jgi:hypothetical protein
VGWRVRARESRGIFLNTSMPICRGSGCKPRNSLQRGWLQFRQRAAADRRRHKPDRAGTRRSPEVESQLCRHGAPAAGPCSRPGERRLKSAGQSGTQVD